MGRQAASSWGSSLHPPKSTMRVVPNVVSSPRPSDECRSLLGCPGHDAGGFLSSAAAHRDAQMPSSSLTSAPEKTSGAMYAGVPTIVFGVESVTADLE